MKIKSNNQFWLLLLTLQFFCVSPSWAIGNPKGILDDQEIYFIKNTIFPILIRSNLCVSATGDCMGKYIFCYSDEALECDAYGITGEKVIKEIIMAVLNSKLKILSFTFWRSKLQDKSFFEKPIFEFIDHTGAK